MPQTHLYEGFSAVRLSHALQLGLIMSLLCIACNYLTIQGISCCSILLVIYSVPLSTLPYLSLVGISTSVGQMTTGIYKKAGLGQENLSCFYSIDGGAHYSTGITCSFSNRIDSLYSSALHCFISNNSYRSRAAGFGAEDNG